MKKLILFVFVLGVISSASAQSNVFKLNVLSAVLRTANAQFEHTLNDKSSIQLGAYYTGAGVQGIKLRGYGITPEYRMYFGSDPAPVGFFVAPFFRYQSWNLINTDTDPQDEAEVSSLGGGVIVGRSWIFSEKVTFEMFIGPKYMDGKLKVISGTDTFDSGFVGGGFGIRGGITVGIAF